MTDNNSDKMLSTDEAAAMIGLKPDTWLRLVKKHVSLPQPVHPGGRWDRRTIRWPAQAVRKWIVERQAG